MSFRNRLIVFFLVIVVVPMLVLAVVGSSLVAESEDGQARARLDQAQRTVTGLYRASLQRNAAAVQGIGGDERLGEAIRAQDRTAVAERLGTLVDERRAVAARFSRPGQAPVRAGGGHAVAPARTRLTDGEAGSPGTLWASAISAEEFLRELQRLTGRLQHAVIDDRGQVLASTIEGVPGTLRGDGTIEVRDVRYRYDTAEVAGFGDERLRVAVLLEDESEGLGWPPLVLSAVVVFLLIALGFALLVSRALQAQIHRLLDAARRVGEGDFHVAVPTEGHDEFAQLGDQFNAMAVQLEQRVEDLRHERGRLQGAIRRVGASFAKGLDRDGVLAIVVETAVDGTGSQGGRVRMQPAEGILRPAAATGENEAHEGALRAAEAGALDARGLEEVRLGEVAAMAHPLRAEHGDRILGVLSVARHGDGYGDADHDLLQYLAGQAAVSIENVALHEAVQRQAITDELTGLYNHRQFQEVVTAEVERTRRFGQQLGLIMVDIDNFKLVNDTHGHLQGDLVLREVARVLRETAREIDIPARYGGEEMVVVLPQTDMEGAYRFAERVRRRIQRLDLPLLDRSGTLRVTASLGVASIPGSAPPDKDALVAAADAALYRAKREGKNRTERADPVPASDPA